MTPISTGDEYSRAATSFKVMTDTQYVTPPQQLVPDHQTSGKFGVSRDYDMLQKMIPTEF